MTSNARGRTAVALFNRGETQSLCVVTVGSTSDTQDLDHVVGGDTEKKFMDESISHVKDLVGITKKLLPEVA